MSSLRPSQFILKLAKKCVRVDVDLILSDNRLFRSSCTSCSLIVLRVLRICLLRSSVNAPPGEPTDHKL